MVDNSKWLNIEVYDNEADKHPNIDTTSLFRWRHQDRVECMAELEFEKDELETNKQSWQARMTNCKQRIKNKDGNEDELKKEIEQLEIEGKDLDRKKGSLLQKEKTMPWDVDTRSQSGFEKTVLNTQATRKSEENLTEEEREKKTKTFVKDNKKLCKQFGMLRKYDDSKRFLQEHPDLVCDDLVTWSIDLEMEGKHDLMAHIAHQYMCMLFMLEVAKKLEADPRSCIGFFFTKIQIFMVHYRREFETEVEAFKERIKKRALVKIQEAYAEAEKEKEKQKRPGPRGLEPMDVFETLPDEPKACFESRGIELLQKTIEDMPIEEAKYHKKRCVDSGLWVCNAADLADDEPDENSSSNGCNKSEKSETTNDTQNDSKKPAEEQIYTGPICNNQ